MSKYTAVLFDLDGTLTDPAEGITNSVFYTLDHYGIPRPPREELYSFIGPPLSESFMKFYGFPERQANEAIQVYREYFSVKGLFENTVYDGMAEMLDTLKEAGYKLGVATAKPEPLSRRILEHFGLMDKFDYLSGNTMTETYKTKAGIIRLALDSMGVTDPGSAIMVGDRMYDVIGAHECGTVSVGVLYGYGTREELEYAGADHICDTVEDTCKLLLSLKE
ncbi:MAG: HAD family hydrolase [Oscillospiraceae bacterium]|nr:HAD family hydrolase [Oscillospiraceae bacterium]